MNCNKKLVLFTLAILFTFSLAPVETMALNPPSFDQKIGDYFFLEFTVVNNPTSAVTGTPLPSVGTNWMVEVDSIVNSSGWNIVSGSIYEEVGGEYQYTWVETALFGAASYEFGRYYYNALTPQYMIGPILENLFPVPFIVPLDMVAVNQTLMNTLSSHFQYYTFQNGTALMEQGGEMGSMSPIQLYGVIIAWNGTTNDPYDLNGIANETVDAMLLAVYFADGELNFLSEMYYDNATNQWITMYKLVTPIWKIFGSMFEGFLIPGSESDMGAIPGFPCAFVIFGIIANIAIIYIKNERKNKILL